MRRSPSATWPSGARGRAGTATRSSSWRPTRGGSKSSSRPCASTWPGSRFSPSGASSGTDARSALVATPTPRRRRRRRPRSPTARSTAASARPTPGCSCPASRSRPPRSPARRCACRARDSWPRTVAPSASRPSSSRRSRSDLSKRSGKEGRPPHRAPRPGVALEPQRPAVRIPESLPRRLRHGLRPARGRTTCWRGPVRCNERPGDCASLFRPRRRRNPRERLTRCQIRHIIHNDRRRQTDPVARDGDQDAALLARNANRGGRPAPQAAARGADPDAALAAAAVARAKMP